MRKEAVPAIRKLTAAVCAAALLTVCFFVPPPAAAQTAEGPYNVIMSLTGDASVSRTVTWDDAENAGAGTVVYSGDEAAVSEAYRSGDVSGVKTVSGVRAVPQSGIDTQCSVFSAELTGLTPGTTYYYYVKSSTGKSGIYDFRTAERNQETFAFAYLGDIQFEGDMEEEYEDWNRLISGVYKKNPDLAFGLQGGDMVQNGIRMGEWNAFLSSASGVFSEIPLMTVNGNHESNMPGGKPKLYLDLFTLPRNGPEGFKEEFYSFDYGSCHVTALNSWVFSGEQDVSSEDYQRILRWIEEDIQGSSAKWKFVVMHHPVYALADDSVADQVRENWAPVFEKCGVDIVFCGHQHVYSRSYPLTQGKIDTENGVLYIMGNSGQKFYSSADETLQERTVYSVSTCQVVRIDGDSLELMTYDRDGNELDYCSLRARERENNQQTGENALLQAIGKLAEKAAEVMTAVRKAA